MECGRTREEGCFVCTDCWSLVPLELRQKIRNPIASVRLAAVREADALIRKLLTRNVRTRKWRRTAATLVSDCGNYTMLVQENAQGHWSWRVVDNAGEIVGFNTCKQENGRKAEQAARTAAKRRVKSLQKLQKLAPHRTVPEVAEFIQAAAERVGFEVPTP
jgi:hypothetical protein